MYYDVTDFSRQILSNVGSGTVERYFILTRNVIYFRGTNATFEERMDALYDDSAAFGAACAAISTIMFVLCMLMVDVLNLAASRQESRS